MAQLRFSGSESQGNITLAVSTTGSDTPSANRPAKIVIGDYSAHPFLTIQAAIDALPNRTKTSHVVVINIGAGTFDGFRVVNFEVGWVFKINGTRQLFTPTTGPGTGTATSGGLGTLTLTGAGWTTDDLVGKFLVITAGTGVDYIFPIGKNTSDTITFAYADGEPALDGTSVFQIEDVVTIIEQDPVSEYSSVQEINVSGGVSLTNIKVDGTGTSYMSAFATSGPGRFSLTTCVAINSYLGIIANNVNAGVYLDHCAMLNCNYSIWAWGSSGISGAGVLVRGGGDGITLQFGDAIFYGLLFISTYYAISVYKGRFTEYGDTNIQNCTYGVLAQLSTVSLNDDTGTFQINGTTYPFSLSQCQMRVSGPLTGTGNSTWGMDASGPGNVVYLNSFTPTIVGTSGGDVTIDGTNDETWAYFNIVGHAATDAATGARVIRS